MEIDNRYRKATIEEAKSISFDILCSVAEFCDKNNLRYYLACGTLLGALRHKGFIPWDDDLDIMMPRPDYDILLKEYNDNIYKVKKPDEGMYFYGKIYDSQTISIVEGMDHVKYKPIGIDIDIFPLDGIVNDDSIVSKLKKRNDFLESLLSLAKQPILYKKGIRRIINRILVRIIGSKNIVKMIIKNSTTYDYENSDYVVRFKNSINGFTGALPKEVYEIDQMEFEGKMFNVPKQYDKWLRTFFGDDYMNIPPIEKRISHDRNYYVLKTKNISL